MVTRRCLKTGGFTEDEAGMEAALLSGWAQVNYPQGQEMTLLTGEAARDYWRGQQTLVSVSLRSILWGRGCGWQRRKRLTAVLL